MTGSCLEPFRLKVVDMLYTDIHALCVEHESPVGDCRAGAARHGEQARRSLSTTMFAEASAEPGRNGGGSGQMTNCCLCLWWFWYNRIVE